MSADVLRRFFEELKKLGYAWQPLTPERLLEARAVLEKHPPLIRLLALGMAVAKAELLGSGITEPLQQDLEENGVLCAVDGEQFQYRCRYAVCGEPGLYVLHDHWPPVHGDEKNYAHIGSESMTLVRLLQERMEAFRQKDVLDLGCSSGVLSFAVAHAATSVHGLDISERAIELAKNTQVAYSLPNLKFTVAAIGTLPALEVVGKNQWDCAMSNPPMVVPAREAAYPHRDGGKLGVELPLKFLDFAEQALKPGGEYFTLCTNPIVNGKSAFFDELRKRGHWQIVEKQRLHSHFNQSVARKQGYAEQGIERIELWFLRLKR